MKAPPPGEMIEVRDGDAVVAVCNVDGELQAMDGVCPHLGASLALGALHGPIVVCPWHAWEFDCRTGECQGDPAVTVRKYEVVVEGGEIVVRLR